MKTVVLKREKERITFCPRFYDFATYYGFIPKLCKPYRAQTKGKVENVIGYVKGNFLCGETFSSLHELNSKGRAWLDTVANAKIHGTTSEVPLERLKKEKLTKIEGKPLFDTSNLEYRRVSRDCFVSYKTNRYSVPWRYVKRDVLVKEKKEKVEIYFEGVLISSHTIPFGKGRIIVNPGHFKGLPLASNHKPIFRPDLAQTGEEVEVRDLSIYETLVRRYKVILETVRENLEKLELNEMATP